MNSPEFPAVALDVRRESEYSTSLQMESLGVQFFIVFETLALVAALMSISQGVHHKVLYVMEGALCLIGLTPAVLESTIVSLETILKQLDTSKKIS